MGRTPGIVGCSRDIMPSAGGVGQFLSRSSRQPLQIQHDVVEKLVVFVIQVELEIFEFASLVNVMVEGQSGPNELDFGRIALFGQIF